MTWNDTPRYDDLPTWDDRKQLLELWQKYAPLPDVDLREGGIFDALIAIATWGYDRRVEEEGGSRLGTSDTRSE